MGYGGPHAAYMAVQRRAETLAARPHRRPVGRIRAGQPAYRLALQTREQHIRREKATSNICTAQVLLAVIASMYAVYHGPEGLAQIARTVHRRTATLAAGLTRLGFTPLNGAAFDTLTVKADDRQDEIVGRARSQGINLRINADRTLGIALDETHDTGDRRGGVAHVRRRVVLCRRRNARARSAACRAWAQDAYLTHPVFHAHRSETELLRYMRKLSDRDLALDRAMIPLGSCTMKLNATTEMIPLTWSAFADLHPFAPHEQAQGYLALFERFEQWLLRHHRLRCGLAAAELRRAG